MKDASGTTWSKFAKSLFDFEYCGECGGDSRDHIPCIGPFGLWFAMCKFQPFDGWIFRNGKVRAI